MTQETEIPEDVMEAATAALYATGSDVWLPRDAVLFIARAILAEREAATKLERERCAIIAEMHEHRGEIALAIRSGS